MAGQLAAGEKTMSQLAEPYEMTMPAVMKHVAVLERSGIVLTEKRGRVRYCRLEPQRLEDAEAWLRETARFWSTRLASLDKYLQENP
jgi:DNA-binding transcriptional ArsR family regulator